VPTVAETLPGYEVVNAYGMVVPAGTPRDVVARLQAEVVKAMDDPEIRAKLIAQGTDPVGSTPEAFGAFLKAETVKWRKVVKDADIKAD
jgi:tripartite-type tricarboxylate transporter receptor subunit TctC